MPIPLPRSLGLDLAITCIDLALLAALWGVLWSAFTEVRVGWGIRGALSIVLLLSAVLLFQSPYLASDLVISDALEYSVAAHRYLFSGSYSLGIAEQSLPPRYPPGFSLIALVPAYRIFGAELGNAIVPVFGSGLVVLVLGFLIAALIGESSPAGFLALFSLLMLPEFRQQAQVPMTDLPALMLLCAALLEGLVVLKRGKVTEWALLRLGLFCAVAILFRSTNVLFLLAIVPLVWSLPGFLRLRNLGALAVFPVLAVVSYPLYDLMVFQDPLRSGYHFWVSIPYDFPALTFSLTYVASNLSLLAASASFVPLGCVAMVAIFLARSRGLPLFDGTRSGLLLKRYTVSLCALGSALGVLFGAYFYCTRRFFLPLSAMVAIFGAILIARALRSQHRKAFLALCFVALLGAAGQRLQRPEVQSPRRLAAERLAKLPPKALIITGLDPVYAQELAVPNKNHQFIPISRRVEFASKVLAPFSLAGRMPQPATWFPHRTAETLAAGAYDAVPWVAVDAPEKLEALLSSGERVFLESSLVQQAEYDLLAARFSLKFVEPNLQELFIVGP